MRAESYLALAFRQAWSILAGSSAAVGAVAVCACKQARHRKQDARMIRLRRQLDRARIGLLIDGILSL